MCNVDDVYINYLMRCGSIRITPGSKRLPSGMTVALCITYSSSLSHGVTKAACLACIQDNGSKHGLLLRRLGISCRSHYACASAFLTFTILLLHLVSPRRPPPPSPPPQSCGAPCTRPRFGRAYCAAACRFLSSARSCSSCRNCLLKAMWWRGMRTPEATPSRTISCNALTPLAVSALRSASWAELSPELSVDLTRDSSDKACSPSRESLGLPMYVCMCTYMHACMHVCMYVCMYVCKYFCTSKATWFPTSSSSLSHARAFDRSISTLLCSCVSICTCVEYLLLERASCGSAALWSDKSRRSLP